RLDGDAGEERAAGQYIPTSEIAQSDSKDQTNCPAQHSLAPANFAGVRANPIPAHEVNAVDPFEHSLQVSRLVAEAARRIDQKRKLSLLQAAAQRRPESAPR